MSDSEAGLQIAARKQELQSTRYFKCLSWDLEVDPYQRYD